jgi:hypothetical protein
MIVKLNRSVILSPSLAIPNLPPLAFLAVAKTKSYPLKCLVIKVWHVISDVERNHAIMLARLGSFILVLSLLANVVMGCANMSNGQSGNGSQPDVTAAQKTIMTATIVNVAMDGCGMSSEKSKTPTNHSPSAPSFCKVFCTTMMIASQLPPSVSQIYDRPKEHALVLATTWDSSVDPPHPRSFDVII